MKIADIDLGERPVLLAPMEDIKSTTRKLTIDDRERPVAIQIYGREPDAMVEAAKIVEEAQPDIIDLNFGCPVKKVAAKGAGAGMLRDIPKMLDITRRVVRAVSLPVTAKTRLGWDCENKIICDLGPQLQDCGIKALAVHGRTRSQMYTGNADWTLIGELKSDPRMEIPIIGNGDICTPQQAVDAFNNYGVDAIMIGRATFGAPWIFHEVRQMLDTGKFTPLTIPEKLELLKRQIRESIDRIDEYRGILHIRRHLAASPLFKGLPDFRQTRIRMLRIEKEQELLDLLDEIEAKWLLSEESPSQAASTAI